MLADRWLRVTFGGACFGLGIHNGTVVMTPDIAKWARGKPEKRVVSWYLRHGAEVEVLRR